MLLELNVQVVIESIKVLVMSIKMMFYRFVFILIGKSDVNIQFSNTKTKFLTSQKKEFEDKTVELATFYLGKRLLAVRFKKCY